MATQQNFDGKILILPGVYSNIKSGIKNVPNAVAYGDLLILDTGSGANAGGGSGINGTITKGPDSVYEFDNIDDFRDFVEKGSWWLLASPLFRPLVENGLASPGVSKITYIKCATTVPASMTFQPQGADSSNSLGGGGKVTIQVRSEGVVGNGILNTNGQLSRGYAFNMESGIRDTSKFILKFYRGTYKGLDQNGLPLDGIAEENCKAELICQSKEFTYVDELIAWMKSDRKFNKYFRLNEALTDAYGDGLVDAADKTAYTVATLASGGTETFNSSDLDDALLIAKNLPIDFIFADKWGAESYHANNVKIANWIADESKFKPQMYVASGSVQADLPVSIQDAADYDSQYVTVVHGGPKKASRFNGTGFSPYDSYYKAAVLLGREAGLQPQIPLTFKAISIEGERHPMNDTERIKALSAGLLVTVPDSGRFEVLKGVNSLQDNDQMLNANGTTHSKQLYRIAHQINKELIITAKRELLNNPAGVNRNSLSELDVLQWTKNFLARKTASPTSDNLILSYQDVSVSRNSDAYSVTYAFTANTEISFLFFTGYLLDAN